MLPKVERRTDLVTMSVACEALGSIVREMRRSMVRSSYSSIIYEGYDFSCVLIDRHGRLIAESGEDHPFHIIPVAGAVAGALKQHGSIGPDDILLHNDPYTGGTHLNDIAVIWPVFIDAASPDGRAAFYVVIRSHWGDVGGMSPGSLNGAATSILQEGLRLNYLKIPRSGASEVMRLIFDNVRVTREAVSDFHSTLGICRVAERRLDALSRRYSAGVLDAAIEDLLDTSERRLRAAVRALPDGVYRHIAYLDGNAATPHPLRVSMALTIDGDQLHADFTGSSDQVAAPLNAGPAIAPTSVLTVVKSFLDPRGPINSGTLRVLDVTAPEGSIVNARAPAACGGLNEVRFACDAAVMGALGRIIPERVTGDVRGTSNHTYIGGNDFIFYEYPSGGTGGFFDGDGNQAVRAFNEGENVSIQSSEVIEAIFPLRVRRNEIRADSGGAGQYRGGCGLIREVEVTQPGAYLSVLSDRNIIPPAGVNGGASGAPNAYCVKRDGALVKLSDFPGKIANFPLATGDVVIMQSSGGGGWGDPTAREASSLADDLEDGYVTAGGVGAYRATALAIRPRPTEGLSAEACRLHPAMAASLGGMPGHLLGALLEVTMRRGPSVRLWLEALDAALAKDEIAIMPGLDLGERPALRFLSAARF
jgi:N-methylhydantoinase B